MASKLTNSPNIREAGFKVKRKGGEAVPVREAFSLPRHPGATPSNASDVFDRPIFQPSRDLDDGAIRSFGLPTPTSKE